MNRHRHLAQMMRSGGGAPPVGGAWVNLINIIDSPNHLAGTTMPDSVGSAGCYLSGNMDYEAIDGDYCIEATQNSWRGEVTLADLAIDMTVGGDDYSFVAGCSKNGRASGGNPMFSNDIGGSIGVAVSTNVGTTDAYSPAGSGTSVAPMDANMRSLLVLTREGGVEKMMVYTQSGGFAEVTGPVATMHSSATKFYLSDGSRHSRFWFFGFRNDVVDAAWVQALFSEWTAGIAGGPGTWRPSN